MNLHTPYPYWLLKNGLLHTYPSPAQDLKTDYLVMGGGITGALVAWHLAQAGRSVIVVDRRHIGMGSTCASTSLLQYEIDTPLYQLAGLVGEADAARSYHLCIEAIDKLEDIARRLPVPTDFERKPSLYYASCRRDVESVDLEFAMRRRHGIRVERLEAKEMSALFPFTALRALWSPQDGAQVDAYALTHALLQDAKRLGAQVFDHTEVADLRHDSTFVEARMTSGCCIQAKQLVIASGYESRDFLKHPGIVQLNSTYALVSEPYPQETLWHKNALIWETARPYLYLRTTGDHRVLIGGKDEPFYDPAKRDRKLGHKTRALVKEFEKRFPGLAPLKVDFSWAGTFAETKDGLPYIGMVKERPHTWFALGFGGNGITFSLIAAELIRDAALGIKNPDARIFSFDRKTN